MTDILALDVASTCGWARGRIGDRAPTCGSVRFAKQGASHDAIFGAAGTWMIDLLKQEPKPDVVAIEALLPPHVIRKRSTQEHDLLPGLHGVIRMVLFLKGVYRPQLVPVQTWRKHFIDLSVVAKGEAKQHVLRKCRSLGWLERADDDAADACGLWSYACARIDPETALQVSPLFMRRAAV